MCVCQREESEKDRETETEIEITNNIRRHKISNEQYRKYHKNSRGQPVGSVVRVQDS